MSRVSNRLLITVAILSVSVVGAFVARRFLATPSVDELAAQARAAIRASDEDRALTLLRQAVTLDPENVPVTELAIDVALRLGQVDTGREFVENSPNLSLAFEVDARNRLGELSLQQDRHEAAEAEWLQVLRLDSAHAAARSQLVALLNLEGRRWEAQAHLFELIRRDQFDMQQLLLFGNAEVMIPLPPEHIEHCLAHSDNLLPLLGVARLAHVLNLSGRSESLLRQIVAAKPDLIEAQARLGYVLQLRNDAEFQTWHSRLPAAADDHPEIWVVRGLWWQSHNDRESATRCFLEAARRDPDHRLAHFSLGQLFHQQSDSTEAAAFTERADAITRLHETLDEVFSHGVSFDLMREASERAEQLGRFWEAAGWCRVALANDKQADWARERLVRTHPKLVPELPQTHPDFAPANTVDLTRFALRSIPDTVDVIAEADASRSAPSASTGISFDEQAADVGLRFQYNNGSDPATEALPIYEFSGGGIGVLDFDSDTVPDLYLSQGCEWPVDPARHDDIDRLFRNRHAASFEDVTEQAGFRGNDFGQGVTAGDFNNDGFADLYVANIGHNRLYRNNGDGTFADVSAEAGIDGRVWTTSCAIVDLNADGLPDIYDVNFLSGEDLFTRACEFEGHPRYCRPLEFPAEQDRVYFNQGDGRFLDVTESSGIVCPSGNGLGIVVADFSQRGMLDIFVANDSVPNFYFVNQSTSDAIQFAESAVVAGLAVNRIGRPEACMGVAIEDVDQNGLYDLFMTNFHNESNTFYMQQSSQLFDDLTSQHNLHDSGYALLGFGTQFLDADLNGNPDLVIANGHVDQLEHAGIPHRMRPLFLRNTGAGRFDNGATEPGLWFAEQHLGRSLARLDWNADGLEDFAVTQLDEPTALVTNTSRQHGHFLAVRLIAIHTARDAIGATVTIRCGDRSIHRQLVAGDGYMCSNQKQLVFGLADATMIDELTVIWPSGSVESFSNIDAGTHVTITEGQRQILRQPHAESM